MSEFEAAPPQARKLLDLPIRELGLQLEGTPLEALVKRLYRELRARGLKLFRPSCYLTDEWGCPSGEPLIGIPFYLADPRLAALERAMNDLEDEREIMMYLRHEAGHAFNYAYGLYEREDWASLFGPFSRPYKEHYRPVPFSRRYVRHLHGWYAQKHPDEDFAETFAVWLTPNGGWRARYKGWSALSKLTYVDAAARRVGNRRPKRASGHADITVADMHQTVGEFYRQLGASRESIDQLALDSELRDIFQKPRRGRGCIAAAELVQAQRLALIDRIAYWTGLQRPLAKLLVESVRDRAAKLELGTLAAHREEALIELTAYLSTLAINHLTPRRFIHHANPVPQGRTSWKI